MERLHRSRGRTERGDGADDDDDAQRQSHGSGGRRRHCRCRSRPCRCRCECGSHRSRLTNEHAPYLQFQVRAQLEVSVTWEWEDTHTRRSITWEYPDTHHSRKRSAEIEEGEHLLRRSSSSSASKPNKKSKSRQSKCNLTLPQDIIHDILLRVPASPLLRFRSACKSWRTLLNDPCFIESHLRRSRRNPCFLIQTERRDHRGVRKLCLYSYEQDKAVANQLFCTRLRTATLAPAMSCDGLIVFHTKVDGIHAWNPSTKELVTLPSCSPNRLLQRKDADNIGFGFDPCSKKYKLVHYFYRSYDYEAGTYSMGFEVLTLGGRSFTNSWRQTPEDPPLPIKKSTPVNVDSAVYWKVNLKIKPDAPKVILRFDLRDEKFTRIPAPLPDSELSSYNKCFLVQIRDSLCFTLCPFGSSLVRLWICNHQANHAWTRSYMINLNTVPSSIEPISITHDERIIFQIRERLEYYDLQREKFEKRVDMIQDVEYFDSKNKLESLMGGSFRVATMYYAESLVPISSFGN